MIQAPNLQYIPAQQFAQPVYVPQGANNAVTYNQTPNVIYNYPTAAYTPQPYYTQPTPQYNGVNIEIINPQGQGQAPYAAPAQQFMPAQVMPAQFMPVAQQVQIPTAYPAYPYNVAQQQVPAAPMPQIPAAPVSVPAPQVEVTPQAAQQPAPQAAAPVVEEAQPVDPSLTPAAFASRLKTDDLDAQKAAIEEVAEAAKFNDNLAPSLLDTQIFDALVDIIDRDTSSLEGPSPEVNALRQKPEEELTAEEKEAARTPAPLEKAEINKQYSLYTIAYMQERLNNELEKRGGNALELKDLPQIDKVVDTVKSNPNPQLRLSAINVLSYIARPEYKQDLTTIFELAKNDEDADVKEAAEKALANLK